ncbi:hypothetical protein SteCoe_29734 [Stentor coeruleus]|uniref:Calpain catalytic domain-containing protein n=1 Tax=Stentor coeruleus TaxID=5963 RepID=A0A1R2B5K0_9CILI|nr:hypothetical protein SteCoe_29734 [Stentor coeruleus]
MSIKEQKIHEGIILYTETVNSKEIYMSILNDMLKILYFTVDLSGSVGIKMKESSNLINIIEIEPKSKVVVATLLLEANWKLSTKFRYATKPPNAQTAQGFIEKDNQRLLRKIERAKSEFRVKDINCFDPSMISSKLGNFVDPFFPPLDSSINLGTDNRIDAVIQWRRPEEFFQGDFKIFDNIEPNDIKQGKLGDCWFMCALASLAERPELVERLFYTKERSPEGFYQVKFCKSGEWVRVTVDDYFPCFPKDIPIFSRSHGNELWVLLLEKAYAKLHGSYALIRGGWAAEGMMDLTGCPTLNIEFSAVDGQEMLKNDEIWPLIKKHDEDGALISASTSGEDRFSEVGAPQKNGGLVPGHAYTVILVKEVLGQRLINIRNPWGNFEWEGDWSDKSPLWTPEMKAEIKPVLDDNDGTFWICYEDFIKQFDGVNICKIDQYQELRIKGIFERKLIGEQEWVSSKNYFIVTSKKDTEITIGIHQEDERNYGVDIKRSYIDLGIVVLDVTGGGFKLYKADEVVIDRQVELDIKIEANKPYLIWPRTSGCALSRPTDAEPAPIVLYENNELHPLFESTIRDIFRKANKMLGENLSYIEFTALMKKVGLQYTEEEFKEIVDRLPSHEEGLTSDGLVEFIREKVQSISQEQLRQWLEIWGYDQELYSIQSRYYVLTFHSHQKLNVQMKKSEGLDLNDKIYEMLMLKSGEKKGITNGVQLYCLMEKASSTFTCGVFNDNSHKVRITLDCSNSEGLIFSSRKNLMDFTIDPKQWKVLCHCQISRTATACKLKPNLRVARVLEDN